MCIRDRLLLSGFLSVCRWLIVCSACCPITVSVFSLDATSSLSRLLPLFSLAQNFSSSLFAASSSRKAMASSAPQEWGAAQAGLSRADQDAVDLGLPAQAPLGVRTRCHKICLYQRHRACNRSARYRCPNCRLRLCWACYHGFNRTLYICGSKCVPPW